MPSRPDRYAVIGNPIAQSRSPAIHARFSEQTGQAIEYGRLLAPVDGFIEAVEQFRAEGGRGLNVTVPFKQQAFAYASRLSTRAEVAGAANFLAFDGADAFADNTDGAGLVADLRERLGIDLAGASVLLVGAGGAARGVVQPLLAAGVARLCVANRTAARAIELVDALSRRIDGAAGRLQGCGLAALAAGAAGGADGAALGRCEVVLNATSGGLSGESLPLDARFLARAALAYDMVYGAVPTPFMRQAREAGCPLVSDGLGMLVEQAAESFLLWRGVRPPTRPVFDALRAELDEQGRRG
jgi:shikimate dehydrogenase